MWVAGDCNEPIASTVEHVSSLLLISLRRTYKKSLESSYDEPPKPFDLFMSVDNEIEEYGAIRFLKEKKTSKKLERDSRLADGNVQDEDNDEEDRNERKRSRDSYEGKNEDSDDDESEDEELDEDKSQKSVWDKFSETEAKRINVLTKQMTLEEYYEFHEARVNSLVSYKKKEFCDWIGIPSNLNADYLSVLGWLSIFRIKNFVLSAMPLKKVRMSSQCLFPVSELTKHDFGVDEICIEALSPTGKTKEEMLSTIDFIRTLISRRANIKAQEIVKSPFWDKFSICSR